ncbi:DnaJ domain-containing protein [Nemania serpens]|nr:DnaJ domain-containing protein [Nemania serpens]
MDHYKVLGVPNDADTATIEKAFKKLSLTHHPDKANARTAPRGRDESAAERKAREKRNNDRFVEIVEARDTLADPKKRREYDRQQERERGKGKSSTGTRAWTTDRGPRPTDRGPGDRSSSKAYPSSSHGSRRPGHGGKYEPGSRRKSCKHDSFGHDSFEHGSFGHDSFRPDDFRHHSSRHDTFGHDDCGHDHSKHHSSRHDSSRHDDFRHHSSRHDDFRHGSSRHHTFGHDDCGHDHSKHHGPRHDSFRPERGPRESFGSSGYRYTSPPPPPPPRGSYGTSKSHHTNQRIDDHLGSLAIEIRYQRMLRDRLRLLMEIMRESPFRDAEPTYFEVVPLFEAQLARNMRAGRAITRAEMDITVVAGHGLDADTERSDIYYDALAASRLHSEGMDDLISELETVVTLEAAERDPLLFAQIRRVFDKYEDFFTSQSIQM